MKVLIGPLNIAQQPYLLAQGLRSHGVDACCLQYGARGGGYFKYRNDRLVLLNGEIGQRELAMLTTLKEALEEDFDIYHFFQKSLLYGTTGQYDRLSGHDIPLIKARGKRIVYRFTGFELIDRDGDLAQNPYSPFKYGWDPGMDEEVKGAYLRYLDEYVDEFMVADPEMQIWLPKARVIPRVLNVAEFEEVGISRNDNPLVLHAPTTKKYKGTDFVLRAFEELASEGLRFQVKLLDRVPYEKAIEWYKKADIIVDQLHVGWYGVLAMECMAMGKPVAVYMREDIVKKTLGEVPIHNVNPDNLKEKLRELITDYELRRDLSLRARQFVTENHDVSVVIPQLISAYEEIMERESRSPAGVADVQYLEEQSKLAGAADAERLAQLPTRQIGAMFARRLPGAVARRARNLVRGRL